MYPRMLKIGSFFFSPEEEVKRFHAVHFGCRNSITVITDLGKEEVWKLTVSNETWLILLNRCNQFVNQETRSNFPSDFLEIPWRRTACPSEISGKLPVAFLCADFACMSFVICLFLQSRSSDCSSCLFQAFRYHPSLFFLLTFLCAVPTIQATVARPAPACEGHALLRAERRVRFEVVFTILASTARERWFTRDRRPLRVYTSSKLNKIIYCSLVPCSFSSWSWNEALLNSREADMKMEKIDIQWGRSI